MDEETENTPLDASGGKLDDDILRRGWSGHTKKME